MDTLVVWGVFVGVAVLLGLVGYHFSVRTLRWVAGVIALGLTLAITAYGLARAAAEPPDLESAFALGADRIGATIFRGLGLGTPVPGPGRVGWVVIIILLVLGYRFLEAWALHWQAPQLDVSKVSAGQPSIKPDGAPGRLVDGMTDGQRHAQLAATLKFRLAAMEVRAPAILPGGSRSGGLATIAEASGVSGAGLAGAIIRFFGMLWPNPRQVLLRVWVEAVTPAHSTRVTVELDNPRTGETIATKTLAAATLDEAATRVAGYVARQIFAMDPSIPPWCIGVSDGSDLSALLRSRQERVPITTPTQMEISRAEQIKLLRKTAPCSQGAGVVRYELAQLYSIRGDPQGEHPTEEEHLAVEEHLTALRLHAINRDQYPRFYRGRYRLGMSLEMIANPGFRLTDCEATRDELDEILAVLNRCGLTKRRRCQEGDIVPAPDGDGGFRLSRALCLELLEAARDELRGVRRQLTLWQVLWAGFAHRDERAIWNPYVSQLRLRQSFHDGACVAELLVAVRRRQNEARPEKEKQKEATPVREKPEEEWRSLRSLKPRHLRLAVRVSSAIAGNEDLLWSSVTPGGQWPPLSPSTDKPAPQDSRDRVHWLPWHRRTASWQAAYNTACLYAALASETPAAAAGASERRAWADRVVVSLRRAVDNQRSEMDRASDWISRDPDFSALSSSPGQFPGFMKFLDAQRQMDYPDFHPKRRALGDARI